MSLNRPIWKLKDWIDKNKLCSYNLSKNPKAIDFLKENQNYINWYSLSSLPEAIELIIENYDKVEWTQLLLNSHPEAIIIFEKYYNNKCHKFEFSRNSGENAVKLVIKNFYNYYHNNPNNYANRDNNCDISKPWFLWYYLSSNEYAIDFLKLNYGEIRWDELSRNPSDEAFKLLEANQHLINWGILCKNKNPKTLELLKNNLDKIDWFILSYNTQDIAIEILLNNYDKIDWYAASSNSHDKIVDILDKNRDLIKWRSFSSNSNPKAIQILKENQDKIVYRIFSKNPGIFELDYQKMKEKNESLYEELIKEVMKPSRVFKDPNYDYIEELFGE
jgi:hypothetical protein